MRPPLNVLEYKEDVLGLYNLKSSWLNVVNISKLLVSLQITWMFACFVLIRLALLGITK